MRTCERQLRHMPAGRHARGRDTRGDTYSGVAAAVTCRALSAWRRPRRRQLALCGRQLCVGRRQRLPQAGDLCPQGVIVASQRLRLR